MGNRGRCFWERRLSLCFTFLLSPMLPGISVRTEFHSSAFIYVAEHNSFCTVGKGNHQLACSSHCLLAAILYVLYAQGSVKHALKSCPLQLYLPVCLCDTCSTSTCIAKSLSSDPLWTSSCLLCHAKATSSSVVTRMKLWDDKECLKPRKAENASIVYFAIEQIRHMGKYHYLL